MVKTKEKILNTIMYNWKKYFCTWSFIVATTSYFILLEFVHICFTYGGNRSHSFITMFFCDIQRGLLRRKYKFYQELMDAELFLWSNCTTHVGEFHVDNLRSS
jgi:hypothetical protein